MPYSDLKAVLKRLERDGVVRISKGKVSIRELPELTKVKLGQKAELLDDPTKGIRAPAGLLQEQWGASDHFKHHGLEVHEGHAGDVQAEQGNEGYW